MANEWKPKIITEDVPGPKSREIIKMKEKFVPKGISITHKVFVEDTEGAYIKDVDGNIFIDFAGGIAVMNIGHSNKKVIDAIKKQSEKFTHTQAYIVPYKVYSELAKKLTEITPIKGTKKKAFFANSGAEAVENAIRIARHYKGVPRIIRFTNSYHGRTLLTLGLTSKYIYKKGSFADGSFIHTAPFPNVNEFPGDKDECVDYCLKQLKYFLEIECTAEETAAIILEPVLGEGGYIPVPRKFLEGVRELCDENDVILIIDEVQSGCGRTGKFWAVEHYGIKPDLLTFGKSIAGGLPLSGVIGREEILDSVHPGGIGGTFGGNPIACAAGLASIDVLQETLKDIGQIEEIFKKRLVELEKKYDVISDVRGLGPMVGIEFKDKNGEPYEKLVLKLIETARNNGLLLLKAGVYNDVVRICGPITPKDTDVVNLGLDILEVSLEECLDVISE